MVTASNHQLQLNALQQQLLLVSLLSELLVKSLKHQQVHDPPIHHNQDNDSR